MADEKEKTTEKPTKKRKHTPSAKEKANLVPGGSAKVAIRTRDILLRKNLEDFCQEYFILGKAREAAAKVGLSTPYGYWLIRQPRIQARVKQIQEKYADKKIGEMIEQAKLDADVVDAHVMDIMERGGSHEYRGEADRVKACELAYKRLRLLDPAKVTVNTQTNVGVQTNANGSAAFQVYQSEWLTEQKQKAVAMLEEKNAEPVTIDADR